MSKAFGTEFYLINKVYQPLTVFNKTPTGKYYVHLATVGRGLKQYMAYLDRDTNDIWIEEVLSSGLDVLKKIENDNEWTDVYCYLNEAKLLRVGVDEEIAVGKEGVLFG